MKRAEAGIREAIRLAPDNASFYGFLASLQLTADAYTDGLEIAEVRIRLDSNNTHCAIVRSIALFELDRIDDAKAAANLVLKIDPESATGHGILGNMELRMGHSAKAVQYFKTCLNLDPSLQWAIEGNIEALKANTFFYKFVVSKICAIAVLPSWAFLLLLFGGWIAAHATPRLAKAYPAWTLPVAGGLLAYFLANAVVRGAEPLLNRLVPISRLSKRQWQITELTDWTPFEIFYLVSLAFLPLSVVWPDGIILSVFADIGLVLSMLGDDIKINRGSILLFVIYVALDVWIRG